MFGSASMTGSKAARRRPTSIILSRRSSEVAAEPVGLGALAAEGLDHERRVERLVRDLGDVGAGLLRDGRGDAHPTLVVPVREAEERADREPDGRERRVGDDQQRRR